MSPEESRAEIERCADVVLEELSWLGAGIYSHSIKTGSIYICFNTLDAVGQLRLANHSSAWLFRWELRTDKATEVIEGGSYRRFHYSNNHVGRLIDHITNYANKIMLGDFQDYPKKYHATKAIVLPNGEHAPPPEPKTSHKAFVANRLLDYLTLGEE